MELATFPPKGKERKGDRLSRPLYPATDFERAGILNYTEKASGSEQRNNREEPRRNLCTFLQVALRSCVFFGDVTFAVFPGHGVE